MYRVGRSIGEWIPGKQVNTCLSTYAKGLRNDEKIPPFVMFGRKVDLRYGPYCF